MPFQKGQSGNPKGRPSGRQAFMDRAKQYLHDYTIEDFTKLARDQEAFKKLSVFDGMMVKWLAMALSKGRGADIDKVFDRIIGKATQPIETENKITLADLVLGSYDKNLTDTDEEKPKT